VPASVKIAAGATAATFVVSHKLVKTTQTVTFSATYQGATQKATLTLGPFQVMAVSIAPSSVIGGTKAVGSVALNAAPGPGSGAITVGLTSASKSAVTPASMVVAIGSQSGSFSVATKAVKSATSASVTATYAESSQSSQVTIQPPTLMSITVTPTSVVGSSTTAVTGAVKLSGIAPTGGMVIQLSSSNVKAATVPATVTVAAGLTSATFKVTHFAQTNQTTAAIKATLGSQSISTNLVVNPK
jgi:hypothetical protein